LAKPAVKKTGTKRHAAPAGTTRKMTARKKEVPARAFAVESARIAKENRCTDVVVMDLRRLSNTTDYFVIATGTSNRQMRTVVDEISKAAKDIGRMRLGMAGYEQARWIVLDLIDVVIHVFDQEYRDYYDLEMLWGDAKRVRVPATRLKKER